MLSIGLVDDHEIFRKSMKSFLESTGKYNIYIEASNGLQFCNLLDNSTKKPDIVLTDYQMPVMNGIETLKSIKSKYPQIKIVLLSAFTHTHLIYKMFQMGADGVILKASSIEGFNLAINNAMHNIQSISDESGNNYSFFSFQERHAKTIKIKLSEKQIDFLRLCAVPEYTYKLIADILQLSPKTVDRYRDELFKKLHVNSRTGLAIYAIQNGLIELSSAEISSNL